MLRRLSFALALAASTAGAQAPKPQAWLLSYDRAVQSHGSVVATRPERSKLVITAKGDSAIGQLIKLATADEPAWVIGDVRGTRKGNVLTFIVVRPTQPMGYFATQWLSIMNWLKETMHGITPTHIEMRLTISGDDIRGTRAVVDADGALIDAPRPVIGKREVP